jgi:hypothetical protein
LERSPHVSGAHALCLVDPITLQLSLDGICHTQIIVPTKCDVRAASQLYEAVSRYRKEPSTSFENVLSLVDNKAIAVANAVSSKNGRDILPKVNPWHRDGVDLSMRQPASIHP